MLGKFGMWWKCSLYEDASRVPCIAAGPDFPSGSRVSTPVDLHDVQAGLFASTGAERPSDWIGRPLQHVPENDVGRVVFSEYHGHGARQSAFMVRKGKWKYLHHVGAPHQLFDLDRDPDELQNVYEAHPAVAAGLEKELRTICDPEAENDARTVHSVTAYRPLSADCELENADGKMKRKRLAGIHRPGRFRP